MDFISKDVLLERSKMHSEPVFVGATQRVVPHQARQVDLVLDQHDVAHLVAAVEAPGRVGQYQRLHAEQREHTHGVRHLEARTHKRTHTHTHKPFYCFHFVFNFMMLG